MDHREAVKQMAAERYLLNELTPELRSAFEEHYFDCPECAFDLRAGAAFVDRAKALLPELTEASSALPLPARPEKKKRQWFFDWRPVFAAPVFATLLAIVGYQNLITLPALRSEASQAREPRLLPWAELHPATRGGAPTAVVADRKQGFVLPVDLGSQPTYASYRFELYDSLGKRVWSYSAAAPRVSEDGAFSLLIPCSGLIQGNYALTVSGISSRGEQIEIDRRVFDLRYND
jgi:hypothetical protein